jgi:hypothetical protein
MSGDVILHVDSKWGDRKYTNYQYHGLRLEAYVTDYVSINYNLGLGKRKYDNKWQFHTPLGAAVGAPLFGIGLVSALTPEKTEICGGYDQFGNETEGGEYDFYGNHVGCETDKKYGWGVFGILGIALIVIPDGISVTLPLGDYFKISPYVNLLGADIGSRPDNGNNAIYFNYSWSIGSRFAFLNNRGLELSANWEYGGSRKIHRSPFFGFSVGYNFAHY